MRNSSDSRIAGAFVAESRRRLRHEYMPKLRRVVGDLSAADLWWRPNPRSNAIGNLLLHLDGNVRQWVVCGIGGAADRRDRDAEFRTNRRPTARALVARLDRTLREVDRTLARLEPEDLLESRSIQTYRVTVLEAVYHVVEHFAGHTGQILYIAKQRLDRDLDFYPHLRGSKRGTPRRPAGAARRRS